MRQSNGQEVKRTFLNAKSIYRYLTSDDKTLDTLIIYQPSELSLYTLDQSLYEALGSITDRKKINFNKLVKLLEVVEILPYRTIMKKERTILTQDRVNEIGGKKNE